MRVSVLQENLAHGLSIVSRAVSPRSTLPVLANVLVATDEGRLRLSATNLELGITCWIGAKIQEEGSTTVPARTFSDLVEHPASGKQVDMDADRAHPDPERALRRLQHRPQVHRRPGIPAHAGAGFLPGHGAQRGGFQRDDPAGGLCRLHRRGPPGADRRAGRPSTATRSPWRPRMASASRCAKRTSPRPLPRPINAVIPARALSELARIAGDGDKTLTMVLPPGRGQVIFRMRDVELVSQLIEGTFPDYEQIIPRRCDTRAVLSTAAFLKACKQAEIFAREGSHIARLNITPRRRAAARHGGDLRAVGGDRLQPERGRCQHRRPARC